ncbi:hypothetical protein SNE40_002268 [Patella caerulea]|uniref:xanthine dehydrogenase n=1 Tax=Patella caerulea TaxID=87958 RepID=A0AAN8QE33_PATCE
MDESKDLLVFYVNGVKTIEHDPDPTCSLLQYLRTKLQLTGAKLVCGEGGCGACTVMISKYDDENRTILHYSVNACLTPVCSVHGLAVTTTEGIGSLRTRLHPVQEQIAKHHGSQCGFCTPGMVMSMYTLLRNNPQPSMTQIEKYLEGNLCRCTGYRPILDGCKLFSKEACALGENCCRNKNGDDDNKNDNKEEKTEAYIPPYDPTQEPIFPPELKVNYAKYHKTSLLFDNNGVKWYRPTTLTELLDLKQKYPGAKIIIGNTEIGIETRFKNIKYDVLIHAANIPELTIITSTEDGIKFGASVTLSKVEEVLQQAIENSAEEKCRVFKAVVEMLKWFASNQIRNTAAIGGNIMTASPISDLNPVFQASTAVLEVISPDKVKRRVAMDAGFFTGYRKTVIKNNEILVSITIPFTHKNAYFETYKQALRKEDDIAIVNAGMRVVFEDESDVIEELYLSYGGMAPTTIMAKNTMSNLVGRKWGDNLVPEACQYLEEDLPLNPGAPGGIVEYRKTLTTSFFFKFYLTVTQQLYSKGILQGKPTPRSYLSAIETHECGPSKGTQVYELVDAAQKDDNPIGRPVIHNSAYQQTTGEAVYIDDMLPIKGELFVAPVYSSRSHATLLDIDPTAALQIPGVKGYIDYRDIPGVNRIVICAEEFFAVDEVTCEGCLIGGVVATSSQTAREASKMVEIKYQDLPAIITVEDAITNDSYFREPLVNECGDVDKGFQLCEKVLEGEVYMGAQEHFYLETQSAIAVPNERDEMDLYSSAQCPAWVQESVAQVLGVPCNKVTCQTKRLGGGFGGKNTQNIPIAVLAAVAAKKYNLPMRCCLERDDDMVMTGTRHPVMAKYTVGYSMDGRIVSLDVNVYGNCGNSIDGSEPTLGNLLRRIDNVYKIPNFRAACHFCKTNIRSNTSIRTCGTVQAIFIIENILQHIIDKHGMDPIKVREMNFYQEGDRTHVNQIIQDCNIEACWQECINQCDYYNRKKQVEIYNRENRWRKRGISIIPLKHGVSIGVIALNQAGALVNVYTDGSVLLAHGGVEMGQGLYIKMIQVASATLGIPADRIHTNEMSTSTVPNASVTAGSTGSDLNGMAVKFACEKICKRLEKYKNEKGSSWNDWVKRAYEDRVSLSATGFYKAPDLGPDPSTNSENSFYYYSYGVGCSEVEIDCLTGDHTVLRTDIVFDVGTSLNPAIDIGQIEGAFVMGHGLHMLEHLKVTPSGTLLTKGPGNYKIPSVGNIPKVFNVSMLKGKPNKRAVYSSKAIGEAPMILSLSIFLAAKSAIMAARHETGIDGYFQFDCPATPDIIRMLCQDEFTKQFPPAEEDNFTPWFVKL